MLSLLKDGAKRNREEKDRRGRRGKSSRGESVDKRLKLAFSPLVINLSFICWQHVLVSAWLHRKVNRSYATMTISGKMHAFLQVFVNGVNWSGSPSGVGARLGFKKAGSAQRKF